MFEQEKGSEKDKKSEERCEVVFIIGLTEY